MRAKIKKQSADLVQIEKSPIPAWHQSSEAKTACPKFYVESEIKGRKQPGGMDSARGNQVHKTGAAIAAWCAHKGVAMDLDAFDRLSKGAGPAAAKILLGMRDSYRVDFAALLATEVPMSLDEFFQPTDVVGAIEGISGDSGLPACYSGILDALYMYREQLKARIDDLKSHFFPYDPDKTLQGKTYGLFVMQHFPWVEEVEFRLIFVRYKNMVRSISYTRKDIPELMEAVKAARARQVMIHQMYDSGETIEAYSGPHCLGGETRFITEKGIRTLKDACGEKVRILNRHGKWEDAEIRSFGVQKLMRITFDDGNTVRATQGHQWWKLKKDHYSEGWVQTDERITTMELERVPIARHADMPSMDEDGIRHGFVYGDGHKRAHRPSCIAVLTPPKDEHMLQYFPGAHKETDGRYRKGRMPGHYKTLQGIQSPSYARRFLAGVLAADGGVCKNGGVHLWCEGREKANALAEVVRFGGGVVSSIYLQSDKPTSYSPKGALSRELMRIEIKPSTAPILTPKHRENIKQKSQMRRMYREVISITEDLVEEVFCAVVPGSESFTLANGIITSNCNYCPLLSDRTCPIGEFNENMQLSWDDRAKFSLWYQIFSKKNNAAMKARVQETGKPITVTDFNGKPYQFKGWESESKVYPLFQATADGIATDKEGNPIMPIVSLLLDKDLIPLDDREWLNKLVISSTKIDGPLKTKKRVLAHQVITDKADKVPKVKFQAKEVDEIPDEMAEEENDSEGEWNDDSEF